MRVSDEKLDELLQALDRQQQRWIEGRFVTGDGFDQAEDMTIFGPFGGGAVPTSVARQEQAASQFAGGTSSRQLVRTIVADDLAVVIAIERNDVHLAGREEPQTWVLRTTQVFRLDDTRGWLRLHRHADPLIRLRPGDETFSIAAD